jgi:hypothetical protein
LALAYFAALAGTPGPGLVGVHLPGTERHLKGGIKSG